MHLKSHKQTKNYMQGLESPHLMGIVVVAIVGLKIKNSWSGRRSDALANKQVFIVPTRAR
jgi:hypothetical protein